MKKKVQFVVFGMLLSMAQYAFAQAPYMFQGYDLDTAQLEWSALGASTNYMLISTVDQLDSLTILGTRTGNIRLRWYLTGSLNHIDPTYDTSFFFKGHARVTQITPVNDIAFYISGVFTDTLFIEQDTLINPNHGTFDPFLIKINRSRILWHWSAHYPQQQAVIHKVRLSSFQNYRLLLVGQETDSVGFIISLDDLSGTQLWKEVVPDVVKITDIYINNLSNTSDMLVTGICSTGAKPFGHLLPTQPITNYQAFLYKRNLLDSTEMFLAAVSHNSPEAVPEILADRVMNLVQFTWASPVQDSTAGWVHRKYRFLSQGAYYSVLRNEFTETESLIYHTKTGLNSGSLTGVNYFSLGNKTTNNPNTITLKDLSYSSPDLTIDMGYASTQPWLGFYQHGRLWLATAFSTTTSFSYPGSWSVDIHFPGINTSEPRWAIIRSGALVSVPTLEQELDFQIFPNPVTGRQLNLRFSEDIPNETNWVIRDLQGKSVLKGNFSTSETTLGLNQLQSGLYLLEISRNNQKAFRKVVLP